MAASVGHHARNRRAVFVTAIKVQVRLLNEKACDVKLRGFPAQPRHMTDTSVNPVGSPEQSYLSRFRLRFVMVMKFFAGLFKSDRTFTRSEIALA